MAYILSIDSSTDQGSVALHLDGKLLSSIEIHKERTHASHLAPAITHLLNICNLEMKELHAVAFSGGPGSYTGLRIGAGLAKGLCFSLDIPLIHVNTLQIIAKGSEIKGIDKPLYIPMIDARRMEVYTAVFNQDFEQITPTEAHIITETSFYDYTQNQTVVFAGNGSDKAQGIISGSTIFVQDVIPHAGKMGTFAFKKFQNNEIEGPNWEPHYLKEFQPGKPKKV